MTQTTPQPTSTPLPLGRARRHLATPLEDRLHLSELPLHPGADPRVAAARVDPFHADLWDGSGAWWPPSSPVTDPARAEALRLLLRTPLKVVKVLGVLQGYRTCTLEQLAALSGVRAAANHDSALMRHLQRTGLVHVGYLRRGHRPSHLDVPLARPGHRDAWAVLAEQLTHLETVGVHAGQGWASDRQYDRHNVLATEVALRCALHLPVATVLGESLSRIDLLLGARPVSKAAHHRVHEPDSPTGREQTERDRRVAQGRAVPANLPAGDLTLVLPDGRRVVVEVMVNLARASVRAKAATWMNALLKAEETEREATTVLFAVVGHDAEARDALRRTARLIHSIAIEPVPDVFVSSESFASLAVVALTDWFPARDFATEHFARLRVLRCDRSQEKPHWLVEDLLPAPTSALADTAAFPTLAPPGRLGEVVNLAGLLGQTPHWLRELTYPPDVRPRVSLLHPAPTRLDRPATHTPLGAARGAVRAATPPPRLLGLAVETKATWGVSS